MNKALAILAIFILGGCGGMPKKEPAPLESFAQVNQQLREPPGVHSVTGSMSLQDLIQVKIPREQKNSWDELGFGKSRSFDYTRFEFNLEKKRKCAVNLWGHAEHEGPPDGKNEEIGGIGGRCWYDEDSFLSADYMRNSARGPTRILTWGREWEMFKFWGNTFSWVTNLSYMEYGIPRKGFKKGLVPIPLSWSLKNGDWSENFTLLRDGKGSPVLIMFLSRYF